MPDPATKLPASAQGTSLLDRDEAILGFNARVLCLARRTDFPLLERLRFLCIVSSNLDEFFEVRMAAHMSALRGEIATPGYSAQSFEAVSRVAHELVDTQYRVFNESLSPALARHGIHVLSHGERNEEQRRWVKEYFHEQVRPLLMPIALDPSHPFPRTANKSLNFIVHLHGKDAFSRMNQIAVVRVPRVLPRLIALPAKLASTPHCFVSLSSVIRGHLSDLFSGRKVDHFSQFRVTRDSDLAVHEDDERNLRTALQEGLQQRNFGEPVRVEVSSGCDPALSDLLLREFSLPPQALYRVSGPVNLVRFMQLADLIARPDLKFPPYAAAWPGAFSRAPSANDSSKPGMFERLKIGDVMIHQPFESFDAVLQFLREAVDDPDVVAIKQTIYRTGSDLEMLRLHRLALQRGKEVLAVVELKARFDEEANISWAEKLEQLGAQVVYGVVGLKTHAKMLLVTRREGSKLVRYGHLSTGNYNPRTARVYTDLGYFTADASLTQDMESVFRQVASHSDIERLRSMWVAPLAMHAKLIKQINELRRAAQKGQVCRIVAKMNAITDEDLIRALIDAGQAGVEIDLIVRGACMLPAAREGVTQRIRVRSVVGRFLEHTRIFYFCMGEQQDVWLASADWMSRNMLRRIEIAWPVRDEALKRRILDECLAPYLLDHANAWEMQSDGSYRACWHDVPERDGAAQYSLDIPSMSFGLEKSAHGFLMAMHGGLPPPVPSLASPTPRAKPARAGSAQGGKAARGAEPKSAAKPPTKLSAPARKNVGTAAGKLARTAESKPANTAAPAPVAGAKAQAAKPRAGRG